MLPSYQPLVVIDPFSLLLVNKSGELKRIRCPFRVMCIQTYSTIYQDKIYVVEMVKTYSGSDIVFIVDGKDYSHSLFSILLS